MELIILAGDFGSRLKSIVNNVPKYLADIKGTSFYTYQFKTGLNKFK